MFTSKTQYKEVRMNTGTVKLGGAIISKKDDCCKNCYPRFKETTIVYTYKDEYCGCYKDTGKQKHIAVTKSHNY